MSVGKEGDQYVKTDLNPEDIRRNVEYLTSIIKWIWENCEVDPCTRALEMNQLRKQEFYDLFQPLFVDTILIASQPGYLLFSDDERLRSYAKTNFGIDAGTELSTLMVSGHRLYCSIVSIEIFLIRLSTIR